jgi:hypothetical protein
VGEGGGQYHGGSAMWVRGGESRVRTCGSVSWGRGEVQYHGVNEGKGRVQQGSGRHDALRMEWTRHAVHACMGMLDAVACASPGRIEGGGVPLIDGRL